MQNSCRDGRESIRGRALLGPVGMLLEFLTCAHRRSSAVCERYAKNALVDAAAVGDRIRPREISAAASGDVAAGP